MGYLYWSSAVLLCFFPSAWEAQSVGDIRTLYLYHGKKMTITHGFMTL